MTSRKTPNVFTARPVASRRGHAADVLDPRLAAGRVQVPVVDVDAIEPLDLHPPAQLHHLRAVVRVEALHPELQRSKARFPLGRDAAEVPEAVVDEHDAPVEVHLVVREAGEVGARREAGGARAERLFAALALGDVLDHRDEVPGSPAAVRASETVTLTHTTERSRRT